MFDPIEKLKEYVACASVSADPAFAEGMRRARDFIAGLLGQIGLEVEIVSTAKEPVVLARRPGPPDWVHVVIYGHYDVQPPDPLDLWTSKPFAAEVRGDRIYGRGTCDNKGPLLVHLAALGQLLEENPDLPLRVTVVVEGEEEIGSPSFSGFLKANRERLRGDLFYLSDTGSPSPDLIAITSGLRGVLTFEVEVTGPRMDLHSGVHGGALLNPVQALSELLASLHTPDGRVAIDGFYDAVRPVEAWEREELRRTGTSAEQYREFLGVPQLHVAPGFTPFEAVRFQPTLEINGIGGGYQGEGSKTVIPARAFAKLSARLVPDQEPDAIWTLLERTLRQRCPQGVNLRLRRGHDGRPYAVVPPGKPNTPANQSPLVAAAFRAMEDAVQEVSGRPPVYLREGGSIPIIADIQSLLGLDSIMLGLTLPDDRPHAPNESFHLGMMDTGIRISRLVLARLAAGK